MLSSGLDMAIARIISLQLWMPTQTYTRSSQQSQSAFQKTVLTGLHGLQWVWKCSYDYEAGKDDMDCLRGMGGGSEGGYNQYSLLICMKLSKYIKLKKTLI